MSKDIFGNDRVWIVQEFKGKGDYGYPVWVPYGVPIQTFLTREEAYTERDFIYRLQPTRRKGTLRVKPYYQAD